MSAPRRDFLALVGGAVQRRAAPTTVMQAVARCYGTMPADRFHDWPEAGLRAAAGAEPPPTLPGQIRRH